MPYVGAQIVLAPRSDVPPGTVFLKVTAGLGPSANYQAGVFRPTRLGGSLFLLLSRDPAASWMSPEAEPPGWRRASVPGR